MATEIQRNWSKRLLRELRNYLLISLYLYICFSTIILNKTALLHSQGIEFTPYGVALIKALVLGKVILVGDVLSLGKNANNAPLLHRVIWKSLAMLLFLLLFKVIEELAIGWYQGETAHQIVAVLIDRTWIEFLAPTMLMLLILVPLTAFIELSRVLGTERLRQALLER